MWLDVIIWLIAGSYAVFTLRLWMVWNTIRDPLAAGTGLPEADTPLLSVVIPVRNEAENILALLGDLEQQTLHRSLFEVWVVDDASTDATRELVMEFAAGSELPLHLLELNDERVLSPKKRAINKAIGKANGRVIVTTDGDCRVGKEWLSAIASCYQATDAKCISGPVTFVKEERLADYLQTVEFSSLVGSGACAIAAGSPNMCNGANFAYEKEAFLEVGGFDGVDHIASGDDEFLLHKLAERHPGQIVFLKSDQAIVQTNPHRSWGAFKRQRQRWASKWGHYRRSAPKILAAFIFFSNLSVILSGLMYGSGWLAGYIFLSAVLLKILPEWLFIGAVLRFLKKESSLIYIPLVQVIYPFYVVFFGLLGQKKSYYWKERELK